MRLSFLAWIAVGCSDYAVERPGRAIDGVPNPRELEPLVHTDAFVQPEPPAIDILWVVDNSTSMIDEAERLSSNFPAFMAFFAETQLDYHIGVISTNMILTEHRGHLLEARGQYWIDRDTVDPVGVFTEMIPYFPGSGHLESGREAVYAALALRGDTNDGFFRDHADLEIIVVSDEDDHSVHVGYDEFVLYMDGLRGRGDDARRVGISAIVGIDLPCEGAREVGADYLSLAETFDGTTFCICEPDWQPFLAELGVGLAGPRHEYVLSRLPVPDTLVVEVAAEGGARVLDAEADWSWDEVRNSVRILGAAPEPGARITVRYQLAAGPGSG